MIGRLGMSEAARLRWPEICEYRAKFDGRMMDWSDPSERFLAFRMQ